MREILFRGKQRIGADQWIFGDLEHFGDQLLIYTRTGEHGFIHPDTVGQWTGLTDRNGVKIFEGDIFIVPDMPKYKYPVVWEYGGFACFIEDSGFSQECIEVIGNIHDNPELLKGKSKK